ncbi:MAG: hypothetical protein A3B10_01400 [Candidatus Doudnabacteria bacterium RIFCSPLOWO2_01_FULL_44_21]|uniref:Uncharacterized protein n=1 Tax=Candidatus Doudnabacteria bacterium RIFCSPLOWO2_01_FULL_44_21 TaxID=1817841 RepID=A0A1F5PWY6_9BACT|nr:MAG: hypothetical protein A3B10_01400 [Candidatus Doudnabacteria bacterium RIFCSPLOWO2_01_FULL_44_21]
MGIIFPVAICSFFLTSDFKGNKYAPIFLSGKIEVFQLVLPIVAVTGSEPKPAAMSPNNFLIIPESFLGTVTKCHAANPGYNHTLA